MAGPRLKLKGVPEFTNSVKLLAAAFPRAARKGLYMGLEFVMTDSKRNYVPVKDGILRASGFILMHKTKISAEIGFGGPAGNGNMGGETNAVDVGYAAVQHENLDFQHKVGEAKFLERPLFAGIPMIGQVISETIRKEGLR
jgi:hypothetical protein